MKKLLTIKIKKFKVLFLLIFLLYFFVSVQEIMSNQELKNYCNKYPSPETLMSLVPKKQQKFMKSLEEFAFHYKIVHK